MGVESQNYNPKLTLSCNAMDTKKEVDKDLEILYIQKKRLLYNKSKSDKCLRKKTDENRSLVEKKRIDSSDDILHFHYFDSIDNLESQINFRNLKERESKKNLDGIQNLIDNSIESIEINENDNFKNTSNHNKKINELENDLIVNKKDITYKKSENSQKEFTISNYKNNEKSENSLNYMKSFKYSSGSYSYEALFFEKKNNIGEIISNINPNINNEIEEDLYNNSDYMKRINDKRPGSISIQNIKNVRENKIFTMNDEKKKIIVKYNSMNPSAFVEKKDENMIFKKINNIKKLEEVENINQEYESSKTSESYISDIENKNENENNDKDKDNLLKNLKKNHFNIAKIAFLGSSKDDNICNY